MPTTPQDSADQPDGIEDESSLPHAACAAERVNEFLSWFGDGRIYLDDPHPPLFARDLQALTNLATGWRQPPAATEWGYRRADEPDSYARRTTDEDAARDIAGRASTGPWVVCKRTAPGPWTAVTS